jgi:small-conductance mechanosensitive channel
MWKAENQGDFSFMRSVYSRMGRRFMIFLPLLLLNFFLPLMDLSPKNFYLLNKILSVLLTIAFSNMLIGLVKVAQDFVIYKYDLKKADNLKERKIRTQLQFLRKFFVFLIIVFTICVILLSFESLRRIGTGLLTGVGIGGIIVGFAAQRSLGNLLAGFQIAFTQPIRIDDVLVVEGEWGRVEEITLTYVVLTIWDQRRLILPINYFIEKPFQNWTRTSAELLGTIFFYLDYSAPVDAIRNEFTRLLNNSDLWDKRVGLIQVTEVTENSIQVRALVSAQNSGASFDLRCYIRENLISFLQKNYPDSLPKTRADVKGTISSATV